MSPHDLDRLLADTAFVRRLARSLVRDPDAADDLAQDALVVAMERPPRTGASPRGWIATVVRRLAIDRARASESRARRETAASRPEHAPAADEIAARLDASQRVAGALRELEEPYRTALYLRYVEDLEPAQIAARLGLPVATVKTHLRRGLELLRRRFDREWGGRAAWSAALIPWATPAAHTGPIAGALFMSTTTKIAAALIVCGAAAWVFWPEQRVTAPARGPDVAAAAQVAPGGLAVDASAPADAPRVALEPEIATAPSATTGSGPYVRVLDDRRFPVEGVHVALHVPGLGDDAATTDADGRARFVRLPGLEAEKRAATVHAWDDRGRAAADARSVKPVDASAGPDAVEKARSLGELVLGPAGSLTVRVESDGRPAPRARVVLQLGAMRRIELEARADDAGRARFDHVPARAALVRASLDGVAGRAETVLAAGRESAVVVNLQLARDIAVRVVDAGTKAPIPGARVEVFESFLVTGEADDLDAGMAGRTFGTYQSFARDLPPADERGVVRVAGLPPEGKFEIHARAEGWTGPQPPSPKPRIPAGAREVVVELTSLHERAARWPLEAGEVAPPPDGTALTLRAETVAKYEFERYSPVPKRAWIERGAIRAEGVLDRIYGCYAVAPDGSLARLWIEDGEAVGHTTSFRRPRRVDVRVLDADGLAAPGVPLEIRNEGNNLLLPAVETDADGRAAFEGLWGRRAEVQSRGVELGTVDLELGDGRVEARLPRARELDVHLRVGGQPRLPPAYRIHAGGATRVVAEDPATGVVRIAFESSDEVGLRVTAAGFLPASVPVVSTVEESVVIDLRGGGSLLARVVPPRIGRVRLRAESWNETKQRWNTDSAHGIDDERFAPNAPDGAYLYEGLAPGRWRVRDVDAEVASEAVDVLAGVRPAEVALDLSGIVRVKGVVELPDGESAWNAHVVVDGEAHAAHASKWLRGSEYVEGHFADAQGQFELSVDATRPVTLRAAHPWLSPHPERGTAVVTGATDDVRLVLVAGDEVQIPIAPFGTRPRESLRVYAYTGDPTGEPARWFRAPVVDGVARFGGLARGTWTLWIDPAHTHAPTVVRGVQVGAGITRVDAQPAAGCALRVRIVNAAGTAVPRIYVVVMSDAEPTILRSINSGGEDVVVLPGIAAGKYRVDFGPIGAQLRERTMEFDGRTDVEVELDLR